MLAAYLAESLKSSRALHIADLRDIEAFLMLALDLLILLTQVVTTINYPTDTLKLLATAADWQVVVVADKKTPEDWALENVIMLSIKQQEALKYTMMDLLPFNHYGYAFLSLSKS